MKEKFYEIAFINTEKVVQKRELIKEKSAKLEKLENKRDKLRNRNLKNLKLGI